MANEPIVEGPLSREEVAERLVRVLIGLKSINGNANSVDMFDDNLVTLLDKSYTKKMDSELGNMYFEFEYRNNAGYRESFINEVYHDFKKINPIISKMISKEGLYEIVEDFCDAANKFRKTMFSYELGFKFKLVKKQQMPIKGNICH